MKPIQRLSKTIGRADFLPTASLAALLCAWVVVQFGCPLVAKHFVLQAAIPDCPPSAAGRAPSLSQPDSDRPADGDVKPVTGLQRGLADRKTPSPGGVADVLDVKKSRPRTALRLTSAALCGVDRISLCVRQCSWQT